MNVVRTAAVLAACAAAATLTGCGHAAAGKPLAIGAPRSLPASRSSRIAVIVMENKEAPAVIGSPAAPYATSLARRYGLATHSYAITHPSLPNYLALTSGSTDGISWTTAFTSSPRSALGIPNTAASATLGWVMRRFSHSCG